MTQIISLIGGTLHTAEPDVGDVPSTPDALERLKGMLSDTTIGTPAGESPTGATASQKPLAVADDGSGPNPNTLASLVAPTVDSSPPDVDKRQEFQDARPVGDAERVEDATSSDTEGAVPQGQLAEAALDDSVRQALANADTHLTELINRIRENMTSQHEADLARTIHESEQREEQAVHEAREQTDAEMMRATEAMRLEHEGELQQVRNDLKLELDAAVKTALAEKERHHAEALKRVTLELDAQHLASLRQVNELVHESLKTLTARMVETT